MVIQGGTTLEDVISIDALAFGSSIWTCFIQEDVEFGSRVGITKVAPTADLQR